MQTTHNGRTFDLTKSEADLPNLYAHGLSVGLDGYTYFGVSLPVGRQRKVINAMFCRSAKTGEFIFII